jgi:gamma-glutamyltranspeptidase/glutathione hydrolase
VALAQGIVVHERLAQSLQSHEAELKRYSGTAAALLVNGRAPRVGERLVQRDLAATLLRIRDGGKNGFYRGRTADLVEAEMRRGGGIVTRDDLLQYEAIWRDPIAFEYRNHAIISMPPPSSGGATIAEILNILEGYEMPALGYLSRDHVHLWTEAVKRAFADRNAYLGDPDFAFQPTGRMTSDVYAAERRADIRRDRATRSAAVRPGLEALPVAYAGGREHEHTTHYSVVDGAGSAVAVTTTINSLYGSRVTVTGAGFLLNNEMDDFAARPGTPNQFGLVQGEVNSVAPKKRMLSAMTPAIVSGVDGRVAQMISNVIDFDMDIASATAARPWAQGRGASGLSG